MQERTRQNGLTGTTIFDLVEERPGTVAAPRWSKNLNSKNIAETVKDFCLFEPNNHDVDDIKTYLKSDKPKEIKKVRDKKQVKLLLKQSDWIQERKMLCYKRGAKLKKRKNQELNYDMDGHSDDSGDANYSDDR